MAIAVALNELNRMNSPPCTHDGILSLVVRPIVNRRNPFRQSNKDNDADERATI
jgi:hypothetical protein